MRLTIVGAGRAAWTFASIFSETGHELTIVARREVPDAFTEHLTADYRPFDSDSVSDAELLLFAVSDRAIEPTYRHFQATIPATTSVFHASGSLSSELFTHSNRFSLHPLCALPVIGERPVSLNGSLVTWEGAPATRATAEMITRAGGGEFRAIETSQKPLYHAAAVFGSNYVAASLEVATRLVEQAGLPGSEEAIRNLALSAIGNWSAQHGDSRFTGPVSRGDTEVVRGHLEALARFPAYEKAYRAMADVLLEELTGSSDSDLHPIAELIRRNRQS